MRHEHAADHVDRTRGIAALEPKPKLSVIVPLYNEEDNVGRLYRRLVDALDSTGVSYELLFVDDGSSDATFLHATTLAENDPRLKLIKFRRNYGQTPAMSAGIDYAQGEILVTMDGDLQNDPADIPALLAEIDKGYDIVVGWRHKRQDKLVTRKIPSRIANWLIGKVTGVPIKDNGCSLKAYRARTIKGIPLYSEMHRFIPAMASLAGTRVAQIKVRHHAREFGTSKYGLSRIYKVLLDLIAIKTLLSSTGKPLSFFGYAASVPAAVCLVALGWLVFSLQQDPSASVVVPLGIAALLASLSIMLLFWGILAELLHQTGDQHLENLAMLTIRRLAPDVSHDDE